MSAWARRRLRRFALVAFFVHLIGWAVVLYARGWRWDPFGTR